MHVRSTPSSLGLIAATLLAFLLCLPAADVFGDQDARRQQARQLVELGQAAFQEERFDEAAIYFQEAFNLDPHPNLMFNIARAHEEMGDLPAALRFYERVIGFSPGERVERVVAERILGIRDMLTEQGYDPDTVTSQTFVPRGSLSIETTPPGARVFLNNEFAGRTPFEASRLNEGSIEIRITLDEHHPITERVNIQGAQHTIVRHELQPRQRIEDYVPPEPGRLTVRAPGRGLLVLIDGRRFGFTPVEDAGIAPGTYTIRIEQEGWSPWESEVTIEPGEALVIDAPVQSLAEASAVDRRSNQRRIGNITMITGGSLALIGAGVGAGALGQAGRYNNRPNDPGRGSARESAQTLALTSDILMATGVAVTAVGAYLRFVQGRERQEADPFADLVFAPAAAPGHVGLQLGGRFR